MKYIHSSIKLILILILVLINRYSFAQHAFGGKITDSRNQSPIHAATVFIPDLQRGTTTDEQGNFSFDNLPVTIVHIQFTSVGYKSIVKTVNVGTTSRFDISMEPSATELEEVLVTSNNTRLPDNTPFPANSISQEEIRKYAAPSLMGNLSYQPGIDKITIGNGIGKPVIRGLSFNQIMIYGQGTRIENQQWDDHHDLGLSDVGIENLEVVRGPAALIYGADALGGALIFRDEKPAPAGTTLADANLGFGSNTLGINADAGIKSSDKNGFFYGVRMGGTSQTSYVQGEEEHPPATGEKEDFAANSKFMNTVGKANVGVSKKWGVSKLSYSYLNQLTGIIEKEPDSVVAAGGDAEQREREMEAPYQGVTTQIVSLENTILTGKSRLNVNIAYQINNRKEFEPLPGKQKRLAIGLNLKTTTFDTKWTSNAEKEFGMTIGTQGTFLKNKNTGEESLVPDATVNDIAGYGLFRYDHNHLNLLGGIRYDARHLVTSSYESGATRTDSFIVLSTHDTLSPKPATNSRKDYTPVSFSLGASYHAGEHLTLKLNGATGFSAPNYAQLATFGKHEGTYRFERGDRNLKVEQNMEADLGLIWENEFITLNAGGYINKVKDYIYILNTGDTMVMITDAVDSLPLYDYKQGDATLSGLEAGFDIHPKSATWMDVSLSYSMTRGMLDAGGNLPYIPAGKLVGELKLMQPKIGKLSDTWFSLIVSNYSKQRNVTKYETSTSGYTLLDAHIGAAFKLGKQNARVSIFCTNLLNTGYYNQLSLVKYIGVRDMGRNIGLQVHLPLYFRSL